MNPWATWEAEKQLGKAAAALQRNEFTVVVCADRAQAVAHLLAAAESANTVGFGGSVSLVELGLPQRLAEAGKECLIHGAPDLTLDQRLDIMRRQLTCDLFLTGTNAVTLDGKLVNIDATGNRVGAMAFGPKQVMVVAGVNKLAADEQTAVARVRSWVAPPNAHRLGVQTPCAETGFCVDCSSPQRICRIVHVMEKKPRLTNMTVLLVAEALGL
ncbi:MAG TPA: lactate utilization protein [Deferrisomatales bacterium]|nr:lactate utilization protein [Deferrisomatales bacterium]